MIFLGPPGLRKTRLAVAFGVQAIDEGYVLYLARTHRLLEDLRQVEAEYRLERRMRIYLAPQELTIDEFRVWPYVRTAATALFALVWARYEKGASILLTSNKPFSEWGAGLSDMGWWRQRFWTGCCTTATCFTFGAKATARWKAEALHTGQS